MAPKSLLSMVTCRGVVTFIVVILGQIISGSYVTFNVTMVAIKEKFNFTQTEVELVLSAVQLGMGFGMPAGILLDRCGPRLTSVAGLLLTTPGLGVMYIATLTEDFFSDKAWLLAIFAFIGGQGFFVTFTISWTTGARKAEPRIRGFLFGTFKSLVIGCPALFTLVYDYFFKKGHIQDAGNQDVGGYILFLLISLVTVDILILILFRDSKSPFKDATTDYQICGDQSNKRNGSALDESTPITEVQYDRTESVLSDGKIKQQTSSESYGTTDTDVVSFLKSADKTNMRNDQDGFKDNFIDSYTDREQSTGYDSGECPPGKGVPNAGYESFDMDQEAQLPTLSDSSSQIKSSSCIVTEDENKPLIKLDMSSLHNHTPFITFLKYPTLQCLLWALGLACLSDSVIYNNIGIITQSVDLQHYNTGLMVVSRLVTCASALISGVLLNCIPSLTTRTVLLTTGSVLVLTADVMFVVSTKHSYVLFTGLSLLGLGTGMLYVIGAGLMFSLFGPKDYGRNWGTVLMLIYILSLLISLILGRMYDEKVSFVESSTCIGEYCTQDWFIILVSLTCVSCILCCIHLLFMYRKRRVASD